MRALLYCSHSFLHVPVPQYAYSTHREDHCKDSDASQGLENSLILPGQKAEAQGCAATVQHLMDLFTFLFAFVSSLAVLLRCSFVNQRFLSEKVGCALYILAK